MAVEGNAREVPDTLDFLTWRQATREHAKLEYCMYRDGQEPTIGQFRELDEWSHFRQSSFRKHMRIN